MSNYDSHKPVLRRAVEITAGPILELGSGEGSTPMLHNLACQQQRILITYETDLQYLSRFANMQNQWHNVRAVPDLNAPHLPVRYPGYDWNIINYGEQQWSVVFVDQSPASGRLVSISACVERAEFIVIHDTECPTYYYEPLLKTFPYRYDYKPSDHMPWTTVVSRFRPFSM
jgi:hypothetical protein